MNGGGGSGGRRESTASPRYASAGQVVGPHYHPFAEESYVICKARGIEIDGTSAALYPGDAVAIPRHHAPHLERGRGALVFVAVCVRAWTRMTRLLD